MSRFYVPKESVAHGEVIVEGQEARHILDSMRMGDGDDVVVFDGTGTEYTGRIKESDRRRKRLIIEILDERKVSDDGMPRITLAQALPKKDKMDYIVEKATELGVSRIVPLVSDRTIVRPEGPGSFRKVERWRKKSLEASKQCGRTSIPEIDGIKTYADMLLEMDGFDLVLMACLSDDTVSIKQALKDREAENILVFIGPEGDFTPEEINQVKGENSRSIDLGKRVLKSDTAGLFVLSVINYEFAL
ncbi:MAG: RsmE family RNA methyltransferase [Candidatus Tantalella remota]|nr:RsmE family RNA methyltransferase [Candidatus Tantalella remota]